MNPPLYDTDVLAVAALIDGGIGISATRMAVLLAGLLVAAAPWAYLLMTAIDLREGIAALRARHPCAAKFLKALAHVVLFAKLLLL